jgi:hypothetical protein
MGRLEKYLIFKGAAIEKKREKLWFYCLSGSAETILQWPGQVVRRILF